MFDVLFEIGGLTNNPSNSKISTIYDDFGQAFKHYEGRVLLLGEAGAGKTITLLNLALDAIIRRMQDPHQPLPLLGIIPSWNDQKPSTIAEWLIDNLPLVDDLQELLTSGDCLLLLDGLDELPNEAQDDQTKEIYNPRLRFIEQLPINNQILITCRTEEYERLGTKTSLNGAVKLKPLDDTQMRAYLLQQPELWEAVRAGMVRALLFERMGSEPLWMPRIWGA